MMQEMAGAFGITAAKAGEAEMMAKKDHKLKKDKFKLFTLHWSPKVMAEMNDMQYKLVKIQGDFVWHHHDETDEIFLVIEGQMEIEFRDDKVELKA